MLLIFKGVYGVTIPNPTVETEQHEDAGRDLGGDAEVGAAGR